MKDLMNIVIFKKEGNEMKTKKNICILCGRVLLEDDKNWWTPNKIRKYKKDFQGKVKTYKISGKEFKQERGGFVCRANNKCIKERK